MLSSMTPSMVLKDNKVLTELKERGYIMVESQFGDMHVIMHTRREIEAASETSGRGKSIVFEGK